MRSKVSLGLVWLTLCLGPGIALALDESQLQGDEVQAMADTFQYALENNPSNSASDWANPDRDHSGAVVPIRTFENAYGEPCREFVTTIIIGDQEEQGYGTACRQPDGHWQLAENEDSTPPPPSRITTYYTDPSPVYYGYPSGFYGPSRIYLSFDYVFRSGKIYRGHRYLDGRSFRHRYPLRVQEQIYIGPSIYTKYRLRDELRYREWERHRDPHRYKVERWDRKKHEDRRDRDREDKREEKKGHR
jgi:surface antigen